MSETTKKEAPPSEDIELETRCGIGSCRPSWAERFATVPLFTVIVSLRNLFPGMSNSYFSAVLATIERQFGLSSTLVGVMRMIDNIGTLIFILILSHFFRYANKPRIFAIASLIAGGAIFLFSAPHYIYYEPSTAQADEINATRMEDSLHWKFCTPYDKRVECTERQKRESAYNVGAVAIFFTSMILQGIAESPGLALGVTYMDDNSGRKSPLHIAAMFAFRAMTPLLGALLGGAMLGIYIDLSDPGFDMSDPRWAGAWWLGFVICGVGTLVFVLPMLLFPTITKDAPEMQKAALKQQQSQTSTVSDVAKDLPRAILRLLKNKLYVMIMIGVCIEIWTLGFIVFLPKYIETYYGLDAANASYMAGIVIAIAFMLGPFISGIVVTRMKTTPFRVVLVAFVTVFTAVASVIVLMFLGCDQRPWVGNDENNITTGELSNQLACSTHNCSCDSSIYNPVCSDNVNYYSPCYAGCPYTNNTEEFTDCQCTPSGSAVRGRCNNGNCGAMSIAYAIGLLCLTLSSSSSTIPMFTVFLKTVEQRDKAIGMAFVGFMIMIWTFPAPTVFGNIIDTSCVVHVTACGGARRNVCLIYDNDRLRYRMHAMLLLVRGVPLIFYSVALYLSRSVHFNDEEDVDATPPVKDGDTHIQANDEKNPHILDSNQNIDAITTEPHLHAYTNDSFYIHKDDCSTKL